ncbi:hypothetical protein [Lysobacter sp. Hz 25]|uniref:hypothetical protein n=1 Tax=Lysobacter sp. Hz 25 TaxID=3383698 RepID=UPI0038D3EBAE
MGAAMVRYSDGFEVRIGDQVLSYELNRGTIVALIDRGEYSAKFPQAEWAYLERGVLVETDFGGLVHYPNGFKHDELSLIARADD